MRTLCKFATIAITNKKDTQNLQNLAELYLLDIHNKHFPGRAGLLFSLVLSLAWLLRLLPAAMFAVSPLLGARDVRAVNAPWDIGPSEVTRRSRGMFKAGQVRWH